MSFIIDGFAPTQGAVDDAVVVKIDSDENQLSPLSNDGFYWWNEARFDTLPGIPFRSETRLGINTDFVLPPISTTANKIVSVTTPKHGKVRIADDMQSVFYTPDPGFEGVDQFDYVLDRDTSNRKQATVSVNVVAPLLAIDDWFLSKPSNITLDLDVLKNDQFNAAEIGDEIARKQFKIVAVTTPDSGGTIRIAENGRELIYSADVGFEGIERFSYTVEDKDGYRDTAEVAIRVTQSTTANEVVWPEQVRQQWLEEVIRRNAFQFGRGIGRFDYYPMPFYATMDLSVTARNTVFAGNASGASALTFSDTNNQVAGVDEGDIVETDGRYLYVFSRQSTVTPVHWARAIEDSSGISNITAQVNDLVIIDAIDPKSPKIVSQLSFAGRSVAQHVSGDRLSIITQDSGKTVVTIVDLADRISPKIVRSTSIDGSFQQSRMIGDKLYVFANSYLQPPIVERFKLSDGSMVFNETGRQFLSRLGGKLFDTSMVNVTNYDADGKQVGDSVSAVTLEEALKTLRANANIQGIYSFDIDASQNGPFDVDMFASNYTSTFFVSTSAAYFFDPHWESVNVDLTQGMERFPTWSSRPTTHINSFSFDPTDGSVSLAATGSVDGSLLNSFSVGEYNGDLQVFTSSGTDGNRLSILHRDGKTLTEIGSIKNIAPGETIYSARLAGDRAYVVTFRQVDPLFVFDLSNPADPKIAGELKLPGYSQYLHRIDATHLLGIGRDADERTGQFGSLQVSLFDIADITNPRLQSSYQFEGGRQTFSKLLEGAFGLSDHHALGYFDEAGILALSLSHYPNWSAIRNDDGTPKSDDLPEVGVLRINTLTGITSLGGVQSPTPINRTIRIDKYLYSIAEDRVIVTDLSDPSVRHAELLLPQPKETPPVDPPNGSGPIITITKIDPVITETPYVWHNHRNRFDVNGDGEVAPVDVLNVINFLKSHGTGTVTELEKPMRERQKSKGLAAETLFQVDVNGDGEIAPLDVLQVINQLRALSQKNGEVESNSSELTATNIASVPSLSSSNEATDSAFASLDAWARKRQR